ncbi:MAG: glutamate--tRNA ligase [Alphaproteobacteria bacterium]|nr:glutamate--tRNA ligase [Alphaproteobacteria bacterium]
MKVVTRFAPSPTGFLHIGGARTALFNWLFAMHHRRHGAGGAFLLRIEDTDRARSTPEAVAAIIGGLKWLGLEWDGEPISQFARRDRHAEAAEALLESGRAYRCYCTPEELTEMREKAKREGKPIRYDGRWRDRDPAEAPAGVKPVIRLKAPTDGETAVGDLVQGEVRVANAQLDDMVLLRGDGTPTYMMAVVVDDHDMDVTHVIRGDDHLTNTFRQIQLYRAFGWDTPRFAHIPLIHGPDGAKLSKRHGALGVEAYRDMGYLPEALRNYLLRLGWGHGDAEIINDDQAIEWFDLSGVGRSPARFDFQKLNSLNGHYLRQADDGRIVELVRPLIAKIVGQPVDRNATERLKRGMAGLKERAKTLQELADSAAFYARSRPLVLSAKAAELLAGAEDRLKKLAGSLAAEADWTASALEARARQFAEAEAVKLGQVAQPLRAALTGEGTSPPIFEVMAVLGRDESLGRIDDVLRKTRAAVA